jgi:hypothetical protein
MDHQQPPDDSRAPADRRERAPWPLWRKIVVYAALFALAVVSIWFINRRV